MQTRQRFQHYVEDWGFPDNHTAEEYDLSLIKQMPISLFVGERDGLCTPERADWFTDNVTATIQNHYVLKGKDHVYPGVSNNPELIDLFVGEVYATELLESTNK